MDFLKKMMDDKMPELVSGLARETGFSAEQAERFVPDAARSVVDAAKDSPDLDFENLAGSAQSILRKVDVAALAQKTGIEPNLASNGLNRLVPQLLEAFREKAGGSAGLVSMLGMLGSGNPGKAIGRLGKIFGK